MGINEEYTCLYCGKLTGKEKSEEFYDLIIPEEIIPRDGLESMYANYYKHSHYKFCNWKCFNLKVLNNAISDLKHSLMNPSEYFLPSNIDNTIDKAKSTLNKLEDFKNMLEKRKIE